MKYSTMTMLSFTLLAGTAQASPTSYLLSGTGTTSTYKNGYAPSVVKAISPITEEALFGKTENRDGGGTLDNITGCAAETESLCFGLGQGNVVAASDEVANGKVCVVRSDLEPEFTFLFSNGQIDEWGTVRKNWAAGRVALVTSAESSGSKATAQDIIAASEDLANAPVEELENWDAVVAAVKDNPRKIGFTHRYADPSGFLNDLGDDHDLNVFGLAEKGLRDVKHADGADVYTVDRAPYNMSKRTLSVESAISMATPVVLFGNCASTLTNEGDREFLDKVHADIAALPAESFAVDLGAITNFVNKHVQRDKENSTGLWSHFDSIVSGGKELLPE